MEVLKSQKVKKNHFKKCFKKALNFSRDRKKSEKKQFNHIEESFSF
jgi:hypothetical protein